MLSKQNFSAGIIAAKLQNKPRPPKITETIHTSSQKEEERLWDCCRRKLQEIKGMPEAVRFLEPVDWKNLGLALYPNIVRNPMDLGTISKKLDKSEYSDIFEFNKDMKLVWSNARRFNQPGSNIHKTAGYLAGI